MRRDFRASMLDLLIVSLYPWTVLHCSNESRCLWFRFGSGRVGSGYSTYGLERPLSMIWWSFGNVISFRTNRVLYLSLRVQRIIAMANLGRRQGPDRIGSGGRLGPESLVFLVRPSPAKAAAVDRVSPADPAGCTAGARRPAGHHAAPRRWPPHARCHHARRCCGTPSATSARWR